MFKRQILAVLLAGFLANPSFDAFAAEGTIHTWTGKGSRRNTTEMELRSPSLGSAADLIPGTDGSGRIGIAANSWASGDFDDLTINDDLTITDDVTISGDVSISGTLTLSTTTISGGQGLRLQTLVASTGTVAPSAAGILIIAGSYELYIATGTGTGAWVKVGQQ